MSDSTWHGHPSGVVTPVMDASSGERAPPGHGRAPTSAPTVTSRLASGPAQSLPTALRVAVHAVIWSTVLVPAVIELSDGWRPTRDDAMISIGSYQVFSSKTPLVGVWSQASEGLRHAIFGLGPLLFWLLAVPVHLDPNHGALWGSAIVYGCVLSIAAEAAWSIRGWPAALVLALMVADLSWQTQMFDNLPWNPYFGLIFLLAGGGHRMGGGRRSLRVVAGDRLLLVGLRPKPPGLRRAGHRPRRRRPSGRPARETPPPTPTLADRRAVGRPRQLGTDARSKRPRPAPATSASSSARTAWVRPSGSTSDSMPWPRRPRPAPSG